MDFQILDIIFVIFLFIMTIFGYIKGFIVRLYDFASTLIVLFCLIFYVSHYLLCGQFIILKKQML